MGKVKQRRHRGARYNPRGVSGSGANGEEEAGRPRWQVETAGLTIVHEKLDSVLVEERVCGLNTLAALALEDHAHTPIVANLLITKVASLLRDPSAEVRVAAAGTLRNISAGGSDKVVEAMVQQDVLAPLAELLKTYAGTWAPAATDLGQPTPRHIDPVANTFIHATHLLWNLCECSEEALSTFNHEDLISVLVRHLDPSAWGHALAMAAAECLLCVSENNPPAASALLPTADTLVTYVSRPAGSAEDLRFATTLAGVLLNINYCGTIDSPQLVLRTLATTLTPDPLMEMKHLVAGAGATDLPAVTTNGTHYSAAATTTITTMQDLDHLISAQQLAFELLSNICCFEDDDDDEWDESGNQSEEDREESMEMGGGGGREEITKDTLPPEMCAGQVVEGLRHYQLFQIALSRANPADQSLKHAAQDFNNAPDLLVKLPVLRVRALLCVQNMAGVLELEDMGGAEAVYAMWLHLGTVAFSSATPDTKLLEAATGAMRTIMDRLSQDKCDKLASITQDDMQTIFEAGVSCEVGSVRVNLARMVGTLACLVVAQTPQDTLAAAPVGPFLTAITNYLFKVAAHDVELWVSAEALDVLIDIYSDDKTDHFAHDVNLVERLKGIHPHFKEKHKLNKKSLGDHRALVLTVRDNLAGFIKYKGPRAAKYRKM